MGNAKLSKPSQWTISIGPLQHIEAGQGVTTTAAPAAKFNPKRHASVIADILRINRIIKDTTSKKLNRGLY
jgi:hypothetical protein